MPVRIYDIAKKLGLESKEVIARAKALGITAAKVPSSSLDKITAEYLTEQIGGKANSTPEPAPLPPEPVVILTAAPEPPPAPELTEPEPPPPEPEPVLAPSTSPLDLTPETAPQPVVEPDQAVHEDASTASPKIPSAQAPVPTEPTPTEPAPLEPQTAPPVPPPVVPLAPPEPAGPKVGDKVGFIKLPSRPQPARPQDRPATPPPRPGVRGAPTPGARPDFGRRPDTGRPGAMGRPGSTGPLRGEAQRPAPSTEPKFVPPSTGELITLKAPVIVRDLAEQLRRKPFQLIADLMELGVFANVNQAIDDTTAQKVCAKHGFRFELEKRERGGGTVHAPVVKKVESDIEDPPESLLTRAPVVTIMGHVDHGKTTLLDVIRKSDVAAGEAGGITQHIGAYTISIPHPERPQERQQITFLDTPGHAAFSAMRARGANVTDIVILVVAANDGVMPQTVEALSHAQAAKVPIIVAVNKCDHPNANTLRVRQQLQEHGLVCEEWGGSTIFADVSALTKQGVDKMLEMIILQAEILELKANPNRRARGNVIESGLAPGGPTATVLVRKGTLKVGDAILCGSFWGKVRALINEEGKRLPEAGPSVAVRVLGLSGVPEAGIEFSVVESDKNARDMAELRMLETRELDKERRPKVTLENLFDTLAAEQGKVLKLVIKADTQGSIEAIVDALRKIDTSKVVLEFVHHAVGTISESDVLLASASKAIVLGFHARIDNGVSDVAKREGVQIKLYAIIYELIDQVKEAMAGLLDPLNREVIIGTAEVRKVFALSKGGNVAGCIVTNGRIVRGKVRVNRRKNLVFEGIVDSLRRFQDEVNEVRSGLEFGVRLGGYDDFQVGDAIECYTIEKVAQKL